MDRTDRKSRRRTTLWPWLIVLLCAVFAEGCLDGSGPSAVTSPDTKSTPEGVKPPPPPPPAPADPAIVFAQGGLQVMNADGSNLTTIHPEGSLPAWSPDGSAIAFQAGNYYAGTSGIYRIDVSVVGGVPTGTNVRRLVSGLVGYSAWSPDGTKIAFIDYDWQTTGTMTLEVVPADGGAREVLFTSNGELRFPTWSRDGTQIAVASGDCIGVLDLATHEITTVLDAEAGALIGGFPTSLEWARTRDAILFQTGGGVADAVYIMELPGGTPIHVVGGAGNKHTRAAMPCWSPDDSEVLYSKGWTDLHKVNVATGAITDLRLDGQFADWRRF